MKLENLAKNFSLAVMLMLGNVFALNCTLRASTQMAVVTETLEFSGTAAATNATYPIEKIEISRDNGETWSGVIGKENWRDLWTAPHEGLFVIKARATDLNGTNAACAPETLDVNVKYLANTPGFVAPLDATPAPAPTVNANATVEPEAVDEPAEEEFFYDEFETPTPSPTPKITATPKPKPVQKANSSKEDALPTPFAVQKKSKPGFLDAVFGAITGFFNGILGMFNAA